MVIMAINTVNNMVDNGTTAQLTNLPPASPRHGQQHGQHSQQQSQQQGQQHRQHGQQHRQHGHGQQHRQHGPQHRQHGQHIYNMVNNMVNNIVKDIVNLTSCKSSTWSATVLNCSDKDFSSSSFSASPSWMSFSIYSFLFFFFFFRVLKMILDNLKNNHNTSKLSPGSSTCRPLTYSAMLPTLNWIWIEFIGLDKLR